MKKVAILTINSNNYGNRLQNYALQQYIKKMNLIPITIKNLTFLNKYHNKYNYILRCIKYIFKRQEFYDGYLRDKNFSKFNLNIEFTKNTFNYFRLKDFVNYDYYISGSDQVWNPNYGRMTNFDLISFCESQKKFSYAASFGVSKISTEYEKKFSTEIKKFKKVSVREDSGKEIVEALTGRNDIEVLIDPTMLLTAEEWDKVSKKPIMLKNNKFILNYFLGEISEERKKEIERVAKENNCEIINILDKNSPFYECGPSEFLYLEKNAFLICTDSFHSSVFAILYNRPFVIFDREQKNVTSMNSRLDTLINKFKLKNRKFEGKITEKNLKHNYEEAYKILEKERQKSERFLKEALDIKE